MYYVLCFGKAPFSPSPALEMTPEQHLFTGNAEVGQVVVQHLSGHLQIAIGANVSRRIIAGARAVLARAGTGAPLASPVAVVIVVVPIRCVVGRVRVFATGNALMLGADLLHKLLLHQVELTLWVLGQLLVDVLHARSADLVHVADGEGGKGDAVDPGLHRLEGHQDGAQLPLPHNLVGKR